MTKKYAKRKTNPRKPTPEAIAAARILDASSVNRPLSPPGIVKCRICRDAGCRVCGKVRL